MTPHPRYTVVVRSLRRLSDAAGEIALERPSGFDFHPGQRIRIHREKEARDYSLITPTAAPALGICFRIVTGGRLTPWLSSLMPGTAITFSGPMGYFLFRPSPREAVFVATGTGIAPFVSMVRSGVRGFTLFHGVREAADLYYGSEIKPAAKRYVPCISREKVRRPGLFQGRVTQVLAESLPPGSYDFYFCGRQEMIRDLTLLVDDRYPGSLVFSEMFF